MRQIPSDLAGAVRALEALSALDICASGPLMQPSVPNLANPSSQRT